MIHFSTQVKTKTSNLKSYIGSSEQSIQTFIQDNMVINKLQDRSITMTDYHNLLVVLFHQVYFSSTSFAIAGAMCSTLDVAARDYLFHHAEEEKSHWNWILDDLNATKYPGPDPRSTYPHWAAQAYLSYGVYLSFFHARGRLSMAHALEGISGKYGLEWGGKFVEQLKLDRKQASFFLSHGELDQGHTQDIIDLLEQSKISPEEWADLENIVSTTCKLYKNMFNASAQLSSESNKS